MDNLKKIFRGKIKNQNENLSEMSKKKKKEFLSTDLIDRMIRVEQRVASSFGEHIPYNKTEYYKNLRESEKLSFNKFLKRKEMRKPLITLFLLLCFISPIFLKIKFSGGIVNENLQNPFLLDGVFILFLLGFIFVLFISVILQKTKKRKFEKYFNILDKIGTRKYISK